MKKTVLLLVALSASFCFGFVTKTLFSESTEGEVEQKKVTGIGGIFFKCKSPKKMKEWYQTHLGLNTNAYGTVFEWWQGADSTKKGFTQWSPFSETTDYFGSASQAFMINYRVHDLEALVATLRENGVTIVDSIETYDYGKFVHILDVEGNKVELWQPDDVAYEKLGEQLGSKTTK